MSFPDKKFAEIGSFTDAYFSQLKDAAASVGREKINQAAEILTNAYANGRIVFSCGNGGSASISNHMVCDHSKLVQTDTDLVPRVVSLSNSIDFMTAIGNDISYEDVFLFQLRSLARPGDVLITISSSGNSENIVRAAHWAKDNGMPVISMTGFSGGRSSEIADVNLHVTGDNYGVIEDVHASLMHILAQYIRMAHMDEGLIKERKF